MICFIARFPSCVTMTLTNDHDAVVRQVVNQLAVSPAPRTGKHHTEYVPRGRRDAEFDLLERFTTRAQQMIRRPLISNGNLTTSLTLKWDRADSKLEVTSQNLASDEWQSYLTTFRPFVVKGDDLYIHQVIGELRRRLNDGDIRRQVDGCGGRVRQAMRGSLVQLVVNDKVQRADDVMDLLFNGVIFHDDQRKLAAWRALSGGMGFVDVSAIVWDLRPGDHLREGTWLSHRG